MRLRQSPIAVLLLVPAGVLAGHALGYAGAGHLHGSSGPTAAHSHGYLTLAVAVATLLAVLALAAAATGPTGVARVSFRGLLALQWGLLLAQEGVEHALAGEPVVTLATSAAVWLSLAAQLAAAAGAALLVHAARALRARLVSLPWGEARPFLLPCRGKVMGHLGRVGSAHLAWTWAARGPPAASA